MFDASLTLDDASGDAVPMVLVKHLPDGTLRIDSGSTLSEPRQLAIRHSTTGAGADLVDRHLIQATTTKIGSSGKPRTATVNMTFAVPRDTAVSANDVKDLAALIIDLVSNGSFGDAGFGATTNMDALFRGES